MRKRIIEADLLDCVLGLGPGLFYNSPMEACVVFCRTQKPAERKGKVLFINAIDEFVREHGQTYLAPHNIERVVQAYEEWAAVSGFAVVTDTGVLLGRDANLSIGLYVNTQSSADASLPRAALGSRVLRWAEEQRALRAAGGAAVDTLGGDFDG
jgi:type I restriction enzyme M protein